MKSIGITIWKLRTAKGWTQAELAERSGVSIATIGQIERLQLTNPRVDTLRMIFDALGCDAETALREILKNE